MNKVKFSNIDQFVDSLMNRNEAAKSTARTLNNFLQEMAENGFKPTHVFDGEELEIATERLAVLDHVFGVDDSEIHFKRNKVKVVCLISLMNTGVESVVDFTVIGTKSVEEAELIHTMILKTLDELDTMGTMAA